jgi:hypothetical protein
MVKRVDFADNVRFAKLSYKREMRQYNRLKSEGCCGSVDEKIIVFFQEFMIGCNYGH